MSRWWLLLSWWCLPWAVLVWLLYLLPAWLMRWHVCGRSPWVRLGAVYVVSDRAPGWYQRLWAEWAGQALPFAVVLNPERASRFTMAHEDRHLWQWLVLGVLFPVVYGVLLCVYGYQRHPLESDARKYALAVLRR